MDDIETSTTKFTSLLLGYKFTMNYLLVITLPSWEQPPEMYAEEKADTKQGVTSMPVVNSR